jgi:hypothetical protein
MLDEATMVTQWSLYLAKLYEHAQEWLTKLTHGSNPLLEWATCREATKQRAPKAPSITWIFFTGHKPLILVRGSNVLTSSLAYPSHHSRTLPLVAMNQIDFQEKNFLTRRLLDQQKVKGAWEVSLI